MTVGAFAQNVTIVSPSNIAGNYPARPAGTFGGTLTNVSGELVVVDDGDLTDVNVDGIPGTTSDGCQAFVNDVSGKIALVDRGECGFVGKAQAAQDNGAIAVIICNNATTMPENVILMGGTDTGVTIPSVMLSYNSCQTIKAEIANGTVMGGILPATDGESCETALTAVEGVNNAPAATGGGSLFNTSVSGLFYKFTPTADALMTVSSCGSTLDTWAYILADGCDVLTVVDNNDDCDLDNGDYGSTVSVIVHAGVEYIIYWDDANSLAANEPFDWTLTLDALPNTNVTLTVDMTYTAPAPEGVKIVINGGAEVDMTDNGDGTWSYTASPLAGSTLDWRFSNGTGNPENDADVAACRTIDVGLDPIETIAYCYGDCFICPVPTDCSNPNAIICENFDDYTVGSSTTDNAPYWSTWVPGDPGIVSDEQAFSAPNSMLIQEGGTQDVLLLLGEKTTGTYDLSWKMYIPTGKIGYHNIQNEETPGVQWNLEVYFGTAGPNGPLTPGVGADITNTTTFSFPYDAWFNVRHVIDLDNNRATLFIDDVLVSSWDYDGNIGAIDFFSADVANNRYWIDDIVYEQLPSCRTDAIICDNFEMYPVPGFTGVDGADWWSTWDGITGTAEDGIITNAESYSGTTSLLVGDNNTQDVLLLLGNQSTGAYRLSWQMKIPTGKHAYFNVQNSETAGAQYNLDVYFNRAAGTTGGNTPGIGVVEQSTTTFDVIEDEWFEVAMAFDLDNDLMSLFMDGELIETRPYTGNIGAIDFYSVDATNTYYIDDVEFLVLPTCEPDAIICDGLEFYGPGTTTGGQAPWWSTWSGTLGTAEEGIVSDETAAHGANSVVVGGTGTQDVILKLGNRTTGNYELSWNMFIPAGHVAYYNMQNNEVPGAGSWNYNVHFGNDAMGATAVFGTGIVPEANNAAFTYPEDTWFPVLQSFDLDNNTYNLWINGVQVVTDGAYPNNLGGIDFFSINSDNLFFIDDVLFTESIPPIPTIDVTFRVNMKNVTVGAAGAKIAGTFNGWTDQAMTNLGNNIWETTIELPVGEEIQWKFKKGAGPADWENNNAELINCGIQNGTDVNRYALLGDANLTLGTYCFNYCVNCDALGADEALFSNAVGMNPNPAGDYVNLTYNFENLTNLNIRLVNSLGQVLAVRNLDNATSGSERLDIASLAGGAYTVVFSNGEQSIAKRLIIQ